MRRILRYWGALSFLLLVQVASAFTLSPISLDLEPFGRGASGTFKLQNDGVESEAIQINILRREIDVNGKETLTPAGEEFTFFPKQVRLGPKKFQTVRVTWKGSATPSQELAYRIIAEQLPVEGASSTLGEGGKVRMVLKYQGTLYIKPKGAKPAVQLVSMERPAGKLGKLELLLSNAGTAHAMLVDFKLQIRTSNGSLEFGPEDLKELRGQNILPRSQRKFVLNAPPNLPEGHLEGTFSVGSK